MARFDEVARLRELAIRAKKVERVKEENVLSVDAEYAIESYRSSFWLLEVVGCFQPGDARALEFFIENLPVIRKNDENSWMSYADYNELDNVIRRLQKAAEIMEGRE